MAVFTIDITKVGAGSPATVDLNDFLGALKDCDPVKDLVQINGVPYVLSSASLGAGAVSAVWGAITGDIANQSDLIALFGSIGSDIIPCANYAAIVAINPGESDKLYVDLSTTPSQGYRWNGSGYTAVGDGGMLGTGGLNKVLKVGVVNGAVVISMVATAITDDGTTVTVSIPVVSTRLIAGADLDANYKLCINGISLLAGNVNLLEVVGRKIEWGAGLAGFELEDSVDYGRTLKYKRAMCHRFTDNNDVELFRTEASGAYQEDERLATENWVTAGFQAKPISLTYAQATTLRDASGIVNEQAYLITDRGDLGIIVIGTPNPKKFQSQALGGFLNADYQNNGDYDLIDSVTGVPLGTFRGVWIEADEAGYGIGDIVIHMGIMYQIIDNSDFGTGYPADNATCYFPFAKANFVTERVGYIQEWDMIDYDFDGDDVLFRMDKRSNIINALSLATFQWGDDNITWQQHDYESYIDCLNNTGYLIGFQHSGSECNFQNNAGVIESGEFAKGIYNISLLSGQYHNKCRNLNPGEFTFPNNKNFSNKLLTEDRSTYDATVDITGLDNIKLTGIEWAGIVTLLSTNAVENIDSIANANGSFNVLFKMQASGIPYVDCDVNFRHNISNIRINERDQTSTTDTVGGFGDVLKIQNPGIFSMRGASENFYETAEFRFLDGKAFLVNGLNYEI